MPAQIEVKWIKLDRDRMEIDQNFPQEGGVYIFMFNNYPFYVGTAEKGNLGARLNKHYQYFKNRKRTYLDEDYFRNYTPWTKGLLELNTETFFEKVFIPGVSEIKRNEINDLKFSEEKSLNLWHGFEIYFGKIEKSDKRILTTLEKNLQLALHDISYVAHNKDIFNIPLTNSTFFGKLEPGNFQNNYIFDLNTNEIPKSELACSIIPLFIKHMPTHLKIKD
jgi:hypothetical protein